MLYEKPEVAVATSSFKAIQSHGMKVTTPSDNQPDSLVIATANAYEADE
ncbi:MAG: hypothetical protein ABSD89_05505 [Halobacteriota archaeon]